MAEPTIKARLVLDTSSSGGLGGSTSSGSSSGLAGAGSGLGKMAAGIGAIAAGIVAIKKLMNKVMQSNPALANSINIMNKSFQLLLRPIGDIMNLFIKPLAIKMLREAIPFYKKMKEKLNGAGGKIGGVAGLVGGGIAGGIGGAKLGGAIGTAIAPGAGTGIGAGIGASLGAAGGAVAGGLLGINVGAKLEEWTKSILNFFADIDWTSLFGSMMSFFTETVPKFFTDIIPSAFDSFKELTYTFFFETSPYYAGYAFESIIIFFSKTLPEVASTAWDYIITFFTETLPNSIVKMGKLLKVFFTITLPEVIIKAWDIIKTFFMVTIPGWVTSGFDKLKTFLLDDIPSWVSSMISKIQESFSSIKSFFSLGRKDAKNERHVNDVIITKSGEVINTHPDDNIMAFKGGMPNNGGGNTTNISINALDASSINSTVINEIVRKITDGMKRGLQGRSSYGVGV